MDQKWILILVIVATCQRTAGESTKEGEKVEITCKLAEMGSMIMWFRVLDKSGIEFIASFSSNGMSKSTLHSSFNSAKIQQNILILKSFNKDKDSGLYSCSTIKNNELKFGQVLRLVGEEVKRVVTSPAPQATSKIPGLSTTTKACTCKSNTSHGPVKNSFFCSPIILGSLAGACGLLLLLLIISTLYCNKIRTRRCPHHYKRRPRTTAPEKLMMTNRHV